MFRLVRGTGHSLVVLDLPHRDQAALPIRDGAFTPIDLTARHPRTGELLSPVQFMVDTLAAAGDVLSIAWQDSYRGSAVCLSQLLVLQFQDLGDPDELLYLRDEAVPLAAEPGCLVPQDVVPLLEGMQGLWLVILRADEGIEEVFEVRVFVCQLVAFESGFLSEGFHGELSLGAQWDAEQEAGHGVGDALDLGGVRGGAGGRGGGGFGHGADH
ncbi:hypothetical protein ABT278_35440 [Streptomyces sp. NPDC001228]|uniref:hypothetical protein n=1 Tax=Streptomyces sp. NPDC001228 TaxID=3154381 RepID=UPI003332E400